MIKALCFDVFGSVVDWRGSIIEDLTAYFKQQGIALDATWIADTWRGTYQPLMERVRSGQQPWTNLDDLHLQSLNELLDQQGITLNDEQLNYVNTTWHRLKAWPDSVAGLTTLRETGYQIMPLSNGNTALLREMAEYAQLPWTRIISAEDVKHYKPQKEAYLGASELLGLEPNEVMMCASHNPDLNAARVNGMKTAFWPRAYEFGKGNAKNQTEATQDWDIIARDIVDLASQLKSV